MSRRRSVLSLLFGLLAAAAGCSGAGNPVYTVETVPVPAGPASSAPGLARGEDGTVYLTWIEARDDGHALLMSRWTGSAWAEPLPVAVGADWFVNWADVPSLCALADGTLAVHWPVKTAPDTYAYEVRAAISGDGGRTWSQPVVPHRDGTPTEHGFVSLFPLGSEAFGLVWLDGRETLGGNAAGDDAGHGHGGGPMTLRAAILDREGGVSGEVRLDGRVCDCCGTDAVVLDDGSVVVVYRDRTEDEVRDISVVRAGPGEDGALEWGDPHRLHEDGWRIAGCPVNGPALTRTGGLLAAAWFTAGDDDRGRVRVAFSEDGGRSFGSPVRVDDGRPLGRVDIAPARDDGVALVVWLEETEDGGAEIRLRRVRPGDAAASSLVLARVSASRATGFPRLVRAADGWLLAWTDAGNDDTRVRTATVR